ncbi:MAG: hypothetical protein HYY84_13335 [Deltaproteobacteria bacterium]|nr:hypothetical protein [Deltaproteobacteria bacterium]
MLLCAGVLACGGSNNDNPGTGADTGVKGSGTGQPPQGGGGTRTGGGGSTSGTLFCCIDGSYYACADQAAYETCGPIAPGECTAKPTSNGLCTTGGGTGGGTGTVDAGVGGGGTPSAAPGDVCRDTTYCTGDKLICVSRSGDTAGTCRLPCESWSTCSRASLSFHKCCPLGNVSTSVCNPNSLAPPTGCN